MQSPWRQIDPVKVHRHALESESQDRVDSVFVLKYRSPPLVLLLLSKHPCGKLLVDDVVDALLSDQPT